MSPKESANALLTSDNILFAVVIISVVHLLVFAFWLIKVRLLFPALSRLVARRHIVTVSEI